MNTYEYQKLRGLKRKLYLIDLRKSCCEKCGYDKNLSALDFHHKEPGEKESQLDMRTLSNSSMKWIIEEFAKCEVLCANCHREEHNPELKIKTVRVTVKKIEDSVVSISDVGKPKCCDCGVEINYTYKRCRECGDKAKRKVERPNLIILEKEKNEHGTSWCGEKYNVSPKTIRKWLKKQIQ
jgi:hypothetical protein